MPTFLLDTNVFANLSRPRPNKHLLAAIEQYASRLVTASTVVHEIWFGVMRLAPSRRREHLERFAELAVGRVPVLAYDERAAQWHAEERARLERRGREPAIADGQIAAIAAVNDAILVTENLDDFSDFEGVELVKWSR